MVYEKLEKFHSSDPRPRNAPRTHPDRRGYVENGDGEASYGTPADTFRYSGRSKRVGSSSTTGTHSF